MTMIDDPRSEAMIEIAQNMMSQGRRRSERVIYYRSPERLPDGRKYDQAGWIGWGDTQQSAQLAKLQRGWIPLPKFGYIQGKRRDDDPDTAFETYGPWGIILSHPDGPAEFPKEQIITYRWYEADNLRMSLNGNIPPTLKVKNGLVQWPQLRGMEIVDYDCPECHNVKRHKPVDLAYHMRLAHGYDRQDIVVLGGEMGIDFSKELVAGGRVRNTFAFEDEPEPEETAAEPEETVFAAATVRPRGRPPGRSTDNG